MCPLSLLYGDVESPGIISVEIILDMAFKDKFVIMQEAAQLPDIKVDANFADELFAKVIGLPASQQEEGYVPPHTKLQVGPYFSRTRHMLTMPPTS